LKDILARLVDPTGGEILIDGVSIKEFKISDIRSRISVVTQNVFLFNASVKENLLMGKEYSEEQVRKAVEDANALEFIEKLENGFDTMIGENGVMLSGGQRQRLSIARSILSDPEILILDEATSALDNESERQIQQALEEIFKKRTTFIIAHRLSTIMKADKIAYIEDGTIQELGTHSELIELNGKYKELYDHQFETV
ncbi:MAG: ATP-binding cassette domain-containing protein, partial [Leptospiraceae bacterium]|nr:ATP-binding cassette domain-containing protein [Leptospiraceae bacterium]